MASFIFVKGPLQNWITKGANDENTNANTENIDEKYSFCITETYFSHPFGVKKTLRKGSANVKTALANGPRRNILDADLSLNTLASGQTKIIRIKL